MGITAMHSQQVVDLLQKLAADADFEWDGTIWRAGGAGIFYHLASEGAALYGGPVQYELPTFKNALVIDTDTDGLDLIAAAHGMKVNDIIDEWVRCMEQAAPLFKRQGYDGIIIIGETGLEVPGPPVEIINLTGHAPRRIGG